MWLLELEPTFALGSAYRGPVMRVGTGGAIGVLFFVVVDFSWELFVLSLLRR